MDRKKRQNENVHQAHQAILYSDLPKCGHLIRIALALSTHTHTRKRIQKNEDTETKNDSCIECAVR